MKPLAALQLRFLQECLRPLTLILAIVLLVPAIQTLPSSRPPQSPSNSGMRLRHHRRTERQRSLGMSQGRAIPRSRQAVAHGTDLQTGPSTQPLLFLDTSVPQYPTGDNPQAMAAGDFNGDGETDLVAVYSDRVSVLLGNGDGTFQPHVDYPIGAAAVSMAVADFNGDGRLDVVTVTDNYVSVLLGNGDGTFQTHVDYLVGGFAIAVGDFNGDRVPDLAVGRSSSLSILLGNGNGTFQTPVDSQLGNALISLAIGDFNNDGKADFVVALETYTLPLTLFTDILLSNGDGTFQEPVQYSVAGPVAVADVNADGDLDLLAPGAVLLGNGDGTFRDPLPTVVGSWWGEEGFAVGDFNGDGKMDLASIFSEYSLVSVLLGNGDGTFRVDAEYATGYDPVSVIVGDFNDDGKADLTVLNNYNGSVGVFLGYGDGTFPKIPPRYVTGYGSVSIASGDFNGDGKADLVTASGSVLLGNGDGTFQPHADYGAGNLGSFAVAVGDFNRDGHDDIATKSYGSVSVLLSNADGSLQTAVDYPVGSGFAELSIAVADFNGDGIPDLAATNEFDSSVSILLGNGDGSFQPHLDYYAGSLPGAIAVADFNADGKADLIVADGSSGGPVNVLLGNGDGTFRPRTAYDSGGEPYQDPDAVATGDFDNDGKIDLAVTHDASDSVSILLGNGDGSFQAPVHYATGYTSNVRNWVGVGDFNGDGKPDLAVVNIADYSISVLLGNGDGTFQAHADYEKGQVYRSATIADFNGDGALDLAFLQPGLFLNAAGVRLNPRGTALELQSSQSSVLLGQSVTFTATIHAGLSGASLPAPTGTLKFMDGTSQLGTQTLGTNGVVTVTTSSLASGTHNISAVYSGDANFNPHTVGLVQVVNGPDFAINATPGTATLRSGGSAVFTLAVSPMYGFNGSVSLTCSISPTPALAPTCSLNPTSVTPTTSGSATSELTIATTSPVASVVHSPFRDDWRALYALLLPVFGSTLVGVGFARGRTGRKKIILGILFSSLLLIALGPQSACGGGGTNHVGSSGTPAGKYTVTVNAASGSATHSTNVTLTVQ